MNSAHGQLTLPLGPDPASLGEFLSLYCGREVSLTVTDNTTTMLSVRERNGTIFLRLHHIFLKAGQDVISEVAAFATGRRGRTPLLRGFIREHAECLPRHRKRTRIRTRGIYHDLGEIFEAVNREYFGNRIPSAITWGVRSPGRAVRRRTLGSYSRHTDTIRINPVLDRRCVPRYFVEFIVYHEMLHAADNLSPGPGRRPIHSGAFLEKERRFHDYDRAIAWEKRHGGL